MTAGYEPRTVGSEAGVDVMLGWFRNLMPKEDRFFDLFMQHALIVVAGAEALQGVLRGGEDVPRYARIVFDREDDADAITRDVMTAVRRSFITPFDRSDIQSLIQSLDDAIDQMKKTVKSIALFEMTEFDPMMAAMGDAIAEAARLTAQAVSLLNSVGSNAAKLSALAEQVTHIEGRADDLHEEGLKALFQAHRDGNAMPYVIGAEIYGNLERVMDRLEDVANEISAIVVENV
jgi:predicted phosphate transport protein (TIGR00153 family)